MNPFFNLFSFVNCCFERFNCYFVLYRSGRDGEPGRNFRSRDIPAGVWSRDKTMVRAHNAGPLLDPGGWRRHPGVGAQTLVQRSLRLGLAARGRYRCSACQQWQIPRDQTIWPPLRQRRLAKCRRFRHLQVLLLLDEPAGFSTQMRAGLRRTEKLRQSKTRVQ